MTDAPADAARTGGAPNNAPGAAPDADWRKLGLIAGGGALPVQVAEGCEAAGKPVFIIGLTGWAEPQAIARFPHDWASVGEIGKIFKRFKEEGCDAASFAGIVRRPDFKTLRVDWRGAKLLPKALAAAGKGDDALLRMIVDAFEAEGFRIIGAEQAARALLAEVGPVGALDAGPEHEGDIALALATARSLGAHDVGQAVTACNGLVLAVEAQEGTDAMLARTAGLPREIRGDASERRGVLVKIPKPGQDRRIDLPTIGVATVEGVAKAGLAGIVVQEGGALIVDRAAVARAADIAGVFVTGRTAIADG